LRELAHDAVMRFENALPAYLAILLLGCPTSRDNARCVLVASPIKPQGDVVPPQLSVMAANPFDAPVRMSADPQVPIRCNGSSTIGGRFYPDSPVDDLTATWLGTGKSDNQPRMVCPAFPSKLVHEAPGIVDRPCGASACENQQLRFESQGVAVHILFYDDPGRHRPDRANDLPSGACYYRLLSMSVSWDGKGPQ
jgi:hypothetical protein